MLIIIAAAGIIAYVIGSKQPGVPVGIAVAFGWVFLTAGIVVVEFLLMSWQQSSRYNK